MSRLVEMSILCFQLSLIFLIQIIHLIIIRAFLQSSFLNAHIQVFRNRTDTMKNLTGSLVLFSKVLKLCLDNHNSDLRLVTKKVSLIASAISLVTDRIACKQ